MADGTVDTLKIVVNWDDKTARAGMTKMLRLLEMIDTTSRGTANSMGKVESAAATAGSKTEQAYRGVTSAAQSATQQHNGVTAALKQENVEMEKTAKTAKKASNDNVSAFSRLGKTAKGALGSVSTLLSTIGRIAFYRAVRALIKGITNAIKTGVNDLYQWSKAMDGEFAAAMDRASTSMLYFKNAIGTVLEPFLLRLIPVLEKVTDAIVDMMNEWNQAVAYLQGRDTFTRAIKVPKAYAEAANDATKANEKLKRSILGFDEINKLNDKTDTAAGSAANGLDYSTMFVTESVNADIPTPVVDAWNTWFDTIEGGATDVFNKLDDGFDKFTTKAAKWVNEHGLTDFVIKINDGFDELDNDIAEWFDDLKNYGKDGLDLLAQDFHDWLVDNGADFSNWWSVIFAAWKGWFKIILSVLSAWLNTMWTGLKGWFNTLWTNISGWFINLWNGLVEWVTALWNTLKSWWTLLIGLFTGNGDKIKEGWDGLWSGLWGMVKAWLNTIIGGVEWFVNCIVNGINWIISTLNSFHFKLPDWLGGYEVGFNIKLIPQVKIPRLADGGIVADGQLFIANEAGPELVGNYGGKSAVMNNAQIVDAVAGGVRDANAEQNALLREQNNLLRELLTTGFTSTISTDSLVSGLNRKNRRDGRTIVPVGV